MWWVFVSLKHLLNIIKLVCRKARNELAPVNFDVGRHILNGCPLFFSRKKMIVF